LTSQAETIRDLLFDNWALTGNLSKVPLDNMKEIVYFLDRQQVEGNEQTKAITVEKINATEEEDRVVHPNFVENIDKYVITIYYRVVDVQQPTYSDALNDVELMARETQRIIDIAFNPTTGTGPFFIKRSRWEKQDMTDQAQPQLERKYYLTLSNVASENDTVFIGFSGVLIFDTSDSAGDNLPASDFEYTELLNVSISEGFTQIPYLTKDVLTNGRGVPYYQRGLYSGVFTAKIMAKKDDIDGVTAEKIYQIFKVQSNTPQIKSGVLKGVSSGQDPIGAISGALKGIPLPHAQLVALTLALTPILLKELTRDGSALDLRWKRFALKEENSFLDRQTQRNTQIGLRQVIIQSRAGFIQMNGAGGNENTIRQIRDGGVDGNRLAQINIVDHSKELFS